MTLTDKNGRPIMGGVVNGDRRAITRSEAKIIAEEIAVKVAEHYMVQVPDMVAGLLVKWGVIEPPPQPEGTTEHDTPEGSKGMGIEGMSAPAPELPS